MSFSTRIITSMKKGNSEEPRKAEKLMKSPKALRTQTYMPKFYGVSFVGYSKFSENSMYMFLMKRNREIAFKFSISNLLEQVKNY